MHSYRVSTSTATSASIATSSISTSGVFQPESAARQHHQGSFACRSTTVYEPKSTHIPAANRQFTQLQLLAEISTSQLQVDPFKALATHQTVTFDDNNEYQEQTIDSLSPSNKPSKTVDSSLIVKEESQKTTLAVLPAKDDRPPQTRTINSIPKHEILPSIADHFQRALSGTVPEALLTAITKSHHFLIRECVAGEKIHPNDSRVILTGDPKIPFKCSYQGCDKRYSRMWNLQVHFFVHTGESPFVCHLGECAGEKFRNKQVLNRHICAKHTFEKPFSCRNCDWRFGRKDFLLKHIKKYHPEALGVKAIEPSSGDSSGAIGHGYQQVLIQRFPRKLKPDSMRRYECEICSKRFLRREHLKYHREHLHTTKNKKKPPNPNSK